MESMYMFVIIIALVCGFGFFNEKVTKLTYEISLMLFSIVVGIVLVVLSTVFSGTNIAETLDTSHFISIKEYLMEGVLCFMLFAGSCHMKLSDFKEMARQITVLSFVCTLLGTCFYGFLFYGAGMLLGVNLSLPVCLMFGSIVAPTDPIAATSILSKFGLPKKISFLIQGESLFNDGVGVALFVCFSGMVKGGGESESIIAVMLREVLGAAGVGIVVTLVCFLIYRYTKSKTLGIFASLLAASGSYALCELFHFSGAIACVICGITFSALRSKFSKDEAPEKTETFDSFWETLDVLLNSLLYIMLGLTFVHVLQMEHIILLSLIAIAANLIARVASLSLSSLIIGKIPDGFNRGSFIALFTWGGLRGGLSVALAVSTQGMVPDDIFFIILGGTYAIVFFTTVIQGLTMKPVYNRISRNIAPQS